MIEAGVFMTLAVQVTPPGNAGNTRSLIPGERRRMWGGEAPIPSFPSDLQLLPS